MGTASRRKRISYQKEKHRQNISKTSPSENRKRVAASSFSHYPTTRCSGRLLPVGPVPLIPGSLVPAALVPGFVGNPSCGLLLRFEKDLRNLRFHFLLTHRFHLLLCTVSVATPSSVHRVSLQSKPYSTKRSLMVLNSRRFALQASSRPRESRVTASYMHPP